MADSNGLFVQAVTAARPQPRLRRALPWAVAVLGIIIAGVIAWKLKPIEPRSVMRFTYELPEGQQFEYSDPVLIVLAVSRDGSQFVYSTTEGLYLRSMGELDARLIAGTDGNSIQPFFSPDGQWIGYLSRSDGKLKKIAVTGGAAMTLCDAGNGGGFSWSPDNRILQGFYENILWFSVDGGKPKPLVEQKGGYLGSPQMLPGGEAVIFMEASSSPCKIMMQSLKSRKSKVLLQGASPQYIKTGHIVYGMGNNLYAVPFNIDTLEITGVSVLVVKGVLNSSYFYGYAVSDSGTLAYVPGTTGSIANRRAFIWVDREGKEEPLGAPPNVYYDCFKISPDGTRVALTIIAGGNYDVWIWDIVRKTMTILTLDKTYDGNPIWTPDGKRIIFSSFREQGRGSIYWKAADVSGKVEKLASVQDRDIWPSSISINGKTLFIGESGGESGNDIGMLSMEGDRTLKLLLQERYGEGQPQISPDGRWLAYQSDESGRWEIYVRSFPDVDNGGRWQISTSGGEFPIWSSDGKEMFYRSPDAIMAVSVETKPTLKLGTPKSLFPNKYIGQFDISPDGKRFLMMKESTGDTSTEETSQPRINIVMNWFEELKERVPVP